jgi:glutathione synthase/RimK-type ligase-like ATP-grasp enzyme
MKPKLAVLYEHPTWFRPLFDALDRGGLRYEAIRLSDHSFDPSSSEIPAPVVLSRVAMSGFVREAEHGIYYAQALLAHWEARGARVLNGARALAIDCSKARQFSLISGLGLGTPATRVAHRARDLPAATEGMAWPLLVKPNVGGSGAEIRLFSDLAELERSIADGTAPRSVDQVLLVRITWRAAAISCAS